LALLLVQRQARSSVPLQRPASAVTATPTAANISPIAQLGIDGGD